MDKKLRWSANIDKSNKNNGATLYVTIALYTMLVLFSGIAPVNAATSPDNTGQKDQILQEAIYQIYAGGINAVTAKLAIIRTKQTYSVALSAYTRGFLGWLVPWEGTFETHGWESKAKIGEHLQPELHRSTGVWKEKTSIKSYTYRRDGTFEELSVKTNNDKSRKQNIENALTEGTIDILTATLNILDQVRSSNASDNTCEGQYKIFDGKRNFNLVFHDKGRQNLSDTRYNIFRGHARECTVEVNPIAGAWHKKPRGWLSIQEQGRERGTMPTMWIATQDVVEHQKQKHSALPVKIRVKTAYGTLFMHLTDYKETSLKTRDTVNVSKISQKRDN